MHFKKLFIILILCFSVSCTNKPILFTEIQIIPEPNNTKRYVASFILNSETEISYSEDFKISAEFLKAYISNGSNIKLKANSASNKINFKKDGSIKNAEGYKLEVLENEITISASTDKGAFYAVQSLRQLLPETFETGNFKHKEVSIQGVLIEDSPEFIYRGMHLDVGRHMYSVDFIKKYIDAMAMLKMNTFHWHLTEDQGWRIEIKKYPKLQEIAAYRNETLVGHYSNQPHQFNGKTYGGYYTQEEIKDIVAYAQERFVTIIPEIEMPGHSQAAIAAYPELGCTGEQVEVAKKWGVFEEIYCTKDETFNFLEDVLDEVLELFPSKYIHIGGDEAPKTRWKACDDCQNRKKDEGLKDEHELQNYFITRIEKYLNSKGRQIIGWDEILEGGLAPNATVMSWRGFDGAIEAAKQHHNVILTPGSHCYFDHYQSESKDEPIAIGGFLPLEKVYNFNPIPDGLTKEEVKYVLGAQGNVWTEYMPTEDQVEYMAFPRMLAMSEVLWIQPENKNYKDFVSRLENFQLRLNALDINYANHLYEIEGSLLSDVGKSFFELKSSTEGKTIRYTLDGKAPSLESEIYKTRIPITKTTELKAAVFNSKKQLGKVFTQKINYHKAVGAKITINKQPHKAYSGSGSEGLINGISGSNSRFGDKEWLGFWGEDIVITIDLGKNTEVNTVVTRFYEAEGQWVYAPRHVHVELLETEDDLILTSPQEILNDNLETVISYKTDEDLSEIKPRFIKIYVDNYGTIPKGKQGVGNKAWTFIDEIIIN